MKLRLRDRQLEAALLRYRVFERADALLAFVEATMRNPKANMLDLLRDVANAPAITSEKKFGMKLAEVLGRKR